MNRSPLFYPLNRGGDTEAGGAADLQTDVMRFMAILSLCLVAIFALVQSIPLTPNIEEPPAPDAAQEVPKQKSVTPPDLPVATVSKPTTPIKLSRPTPQKPVAREKPVRLERPQAVPVRESSAAPTPMPAKVEPAVAAPEPAQEGFTLQFETDAALTRLVARQVVGLYAMTPDKTLRMGVDGEKIEFWPASLPGKFHEMDVSTVPDNVLAAYPNQQKQNLKWGVTLPADMTQELDNYLSSASGGSLVIASNGDIDLRQ